MFHAQSGTFHRLISTGRIDQQWVLSHQLKLRLTGQIVRLWCERAVQDKDITATHYCFERVHIASPHSLPVSSV